MTSRIPVTTASFDQTRLIERPDGFYWQSIEDNHEHGPFTSLQEAVNDMEYSESEAAIQVGESIEEAESEIGIADWIDPTTGEPAEDSVPHINEY